MLTLLDQPRTGSQTHVPKGKAYLNVPYNYGNLSIPHSSSITLAKLIETISFTMILKEAWYKRKKITSISSWEMSGA